MKIELSQFEVELLDRALNAWEGEPSSNAAIGGIMGAIFGGLAGRERHAEFREEGRQVKLDAEKETQRRRLQAALLRAKLLQALAVNSEHSLDENPSTPPQLKVNEHCHN